MRDNRVTALDKLKREALALGANAVIGVGFSIAALGVNGSMTLVSATGHSRSLLHG